MVARDVGGAGLDALEEVRVVAALAQLHDDVEQLGPVGGALDGVDVRLEQGAVLVSLHVGHADFEDRLLFGGQRFFDVRLEAAQQEGAQYFVQLGHDLGLIARGVVVGGVGGGGGSGVARRKPCFKRIGRRKHLGQQKVEQSPQLAQVVLQRRARDQQAVGGVQPLDDGEEHGFLVFDAVRFVDDDVLPFRRQKRGLLLDHHLVRRHAHVERALARHARLLVGALLLGAVKLDRANHGAPLFKLVDPVVQRRFGHDHQVGARDAAELVQVAQQGDGLQGFAEAHLVRVWVVGGGVGGRVSVERENDEKQKTLSLPPSHLVRQDAVHRVVVQVDEPVEAVHLWCVGVA